MQISTRFTEYGLTGAFFWIGQLLLLLALGQPADAAFRWLADWVPRLQNIPQFAQTLLMSLVGALAIIAVFIAGLLLDLFGSYFIFMEMAVFKRHADRNREWLEDLVAKHGVYGARDYDIFTRKFGNPFSGREWRTAFDVFLFWSRERRRRYVAAWKRAWERFKLIRPYHRLWSFLFSYVVVQSGASQLNVLVDEMYLWRTGRAISTALMILFLETQVPIFQWIDLFDSLWVIVTLGYLLPIAVTGAAFLITLGTYSRLCFTLFSLVYVTHEKVSHGKVGVGPS